MRSATRGLARISEDRSGEGAGVERQLAEIRQLCAERGLDLVGEFVDNDVSASSGKRRPQWEALCERLSAGGVEVLVAWHTDRLYRRPRDLEALLDLVEGRGLRVLTVRAGELDLDTASGRLVARMLGAAARAETERSSERIASAAAEAARQGRPGGGVRPLGYLAGGLEPHPVEGPALQRAAERLLAGATIVDTARLFAAETDRDSVDRASLRRALTSHRVAGLRSRIPQAERQRYARARARGEDPPEPTPAVSEAVWPAVVDRETWTQVRALLLDPSRRRKRPARKGLLVGVLRCGRCGSGMVSGQAGEGRRSYRCQQSVARGTERASCGVSILAEPVDGLVVGTVGELVAGSAGDLAQRLADRGDGAQSPEVAEVEALTKRRDEALALFREGVLSADELRSLRRDLDGRLAALGSAVAERERRRVAASNVASVLRRWGSASLSERRTVVSALVESITVAPVGRGRQRGGGSGGRRTGVDLGRVEVRWRA